MTVNTFIEKAQWPKSTTERVVAVRQALGRLARPALVTDVAAQFPRAREAEVADVLDALGVVQRSDEGRYSA